MVAACLDEPDFCGGELSGKALFWPECIRLLLSASGGRKRESRMSRGVDEENLASFDSEDNEPRGCGDASRSLPWLNVRDKAVARLNPCTVSRTWAKDAEVGDKVRD